MRRRAVLIAAVATVLVVSATVFLWSRARPSQSPGTIRVGYQATMLYLPVFVAQENGLFEKNGVVVELVRFGSANEMAQALATGRIDATGMSSLTVLANLEKNAPGTFRIYLLEIITAKLSPDAVIVASTSQIKTLSDLRGKKLGLNPGTTLQSYAERFLRAAVGQDHGVTFVPLQPQVQVQSLSSGSVDALYALEPTPTLAESEIGARIVARGLLAQHVHDPFYAGAGVIGKTTLESRPERVAAYRAAIRDALQLISSRERDARLAMVKYASVNPQTAQRMALVGWVEPRGIAMSDWHESIRALVEMGEMPAEVELEPTFLPN